MIYGHDETNLIVSVPEISFCALLQPGFVFGANDVHSHVSNAVRPDWTIFVRWWHSSLMALLILRNTFTLLRIIELTRTKTTNFRFRTQIIYHILYGPVHFRLHFIFTTCHGLHHVWIASSLFPSLTFDSLAANCIHLFPCNSLRMWFYVRLQCGLTNMKLIITFMRRSSKTGKTGKSLSVFLGLQHALVVALRILLQYFE